MTLACHASYLKGGLARMPDDNTTDRKASDDRDQEHAELIVTSLASAQLQVEQVGEHQWMTVLSGDYKRTIPVMIELDERSLNVTSLFTGVPDEGHAQVYRLLLQKNQRPRPVHFALDDAGDIVLVGQLPRRALDTATFESLLGALLTMADETFNQVLRTGFVGYLAAEQRWRERAGLPPNPVGLRSRDEDDE
ncbi:MAG: YbjN domain-containing protein [Nitriliruptoraceae bacterium]